ncbi:hypothetical protein SPRG_20448, partial [Saprolegnia parasitica CBS 223.65]
MMLSPPFAVHLQWQLMACGFSRRGVIVCQVAQHSSPRRPLVCALPCSSHSSKSRPLTLLGCHSGLLHERIPKSTIFRNTCSKLISTT